VCKVGEFVTVCTQIETLDETDSDIEWFDADDASEIENSSDEVKEEYPMVIDLDRATKTERSHMPRNGRKSYTLFSWK
jgi:hypothetical protein